ncbi:MAG: hypothetical protein Q8W51_03195 [Candidatus Palauibacterales bacterium]|nr:hypothetical protein [Candidatus Palauibacterales bacterium]MDP2528718.1 hypothetical protein [Candidatus Palauibacterales bacterium]MDP2585236.1 hypothetical protein [Candidatus Palauibacterales bacterium]
MLYGFMTTAALTAAAVGAGPSTTNPAAAVRADSAGPEHVTIVATDYAFQAPDSIRAGLVDLRLVNDGRQAHQAWLLRLDDGKTMQDFLDATRFEPWMVDVGGPNAVGPGSRASATLILSPGNYVVICLMLDPKGRSHLALGMKRALRVVGPAPAVAEGLPAADDTVRLTNYSFLIAHPLAAGRHRLLVRNEADQPHELTLVRLAPGKGPFDFARWSEKQADPPAGQWLGGVTGLSPGREAEAEVDLRPGHYAFLCFLPDATDGKPHFEHGMVSAFTVR